MGVNTPEIGEEGYEEAKEFVNKTCWGEVVKLDVDAKEQYDPQYRILAVVYVNETNLNEKLVGEGYAEIRVIPPSEFNPDTLNTIIAAAAILFALLGGFITQYMLTRNEKIIRHLGTDYHHLRDTLYLFNFEPLYKNPDKSKKILGPIFDYLAYVCQLWYIPAVQGGHLRKEVLEAYQAHDLTNELKEHFLDTAKKFEESRGEVRAFPSGLFGFVLVILILLAGTTLVGLWITLIYEPTSFNLLFSVFYAALSIFFVLFFFFIYDLKRLDAFFVILLINNLLKWLFIRCLIFASTDKDEDKETTGDYTKNVSEYLKKVKIPYDEYTNRGCIQNDTRREALDKAEKIAEQFLKKRKKRHEDREKEVDLKKREKMKEDWEEKVEWTVPRAATEVVLRGRWFKLAYVAFTAAFSGILIFPPHFFSYFQLLSLPWIVILAVIVIVGPVVFYLFLYWVGEGKSLFRQRRGVKNVSFLEDLSRCWDEIIEQYNKEKKMREVDKQEEAIYEEVVKRIRECIENHT